MAPPVLVSAVLLLLTSAFAGCTLFPFSAPAKEPPSIVEQPELPPGEVFTPKPPTPPPPFNPANSTSFFDAKAQLGPDEDGILQYLDNFKLSVPKGALNATVNMSVSMLDPGEWASLHLSEKLAKMAGRVFDVEPDGLPFDRPVHANLSLDFLNLSKLNGTVNFSQGLPLIFPGTLLPDGTLAPLPNATVHFDFATGKVWVGTDLSFLDDIVLALGPVWASVAPWEVTAFVGESWTSMVTLRGPTEESNFTVDDIAAVATSPVASTTAAPRPGVVHTLESFPVVFTCTAPGHGTFGIRFTALVGLGGDPLFLEETYQVTEMAHCVEKPTLTATLVAPHTRFEVRAPKPPDPPTLDPFIPGRVVHEWTTQISCGTIEAAGLRQAAAGKATYYLSGPHLNWSHPNVPQGQTAMDGDEDGAPDLCPHSETPNYSHPGTFRADLHYRLPRTGDTSGPEGGGGLKYDPFYGGRVTCHYSGSLSGTGTCTPESVWQLLLVLGKPGNH